MPADITSAEYKPVFVKRSERWCEACGTITHLTLDCAEPTCDTCHTLYPVIELGPDTSHLPTSPFEYSQFMGAR